MTKEKATKLHIGEGILKPGTRPIKVYVDKNGEYMDGSKTYKLNIPADVPAKDFWSIVVYDPQTRSQLQTSQPFPGKNNQRQYPPGFNVK